MLIDNNYVHRHEKGFIICHWMNAISFIMLFVTALPLYTDTFKFLYDVFGAYNLQIMHRVFAVIFIVTPFLGFFIARKGFSLWAKEILTVNPAEDMAFMSKFPLELIGLHPEGVPKQGFYNSGERMNSALQIGIWLLLVASGLALWVGNSYLSRETMAWMGPLHSAAAGLGFAAFLAHLYLAAVANPDSLRGMRKGNIHVRYAKAHHEKWYEDLIARGEFTREEAEKAIKADAMGKSASGSM
ncbi:formate dehydrogenase subunit gamma [Sporomusa malonica]|uniref:Formate dehydrogenase subunit gamma n=2 Tax=Sporomusa malonica TaxID=112901 RepID=A0A1W1YGK0_9FIRM|nr:cytochrome b/b6 domain-containing protein [Sporomusa malonica]SMC35269.1 formate dehydrogenase subunit gamma [Sporomusa malonica]